MKNILLFGCGHHGERYVNYFKNIPDFNLYIVEIQKDRLSQIRFKFKEYQNIFLYNSIEEFEQQDIDVEYGIVSNWAVDRIETIKYLKNINCSKILVEKPFATSIKDLYTINSMQNKEFMIYPSLPNNFSSFYSNLSDIVNTYNLGEIQSMHVNCGAKGLINNGVHYVDIANNLFNSKFEESLGKVTYDFINPRNKDLKFYAGNLLFYFENDKLLNLNFYNKSMMSSVFDFIYRFGRITINENGDGYLHYINRNNRDLPITKTKDGERIKLNDFFGDYITSFRNNIDFFIKEDNFKLVEKFYVKSSLSLETLYKAIYQSLDLERDFNLNTS